MSWGSTNVVDLFNIPDLNAVWSRPSGISFCFAELYAMPLVFNPDLGQANIALF
jgi:hypothetical protein